MSYVTYDSHRSPWERLDWLEPTGEGKITVRRNGIPRQTFNDVTDIGVSEEDIIVVREEGSEPADVDQKVWLRIGYAIIVGLAIFLIGVVFRFIYPGPMPLAVAAIGMTSVAIALWRGGKLDQAA
jgi:hypothetical protein